MGADIRLLRFTLSNLNALNTQSKESLVSAINETKNTLESVIGFIFLENNRLNDEGIGSGIIWSANKIIDYVAQVKASIVDGAAGEYDTLREIANYLTANDGEMATLLSMLSGTVRVDIAQALSNIEKQTTNTTLGLGSVDYSMVDTYRSLVPMPVIDFISPFVTETVLSSVYSVTFTPGTALEYIEVAGNRVDRARLLTVGTTPLILLTQKGQITLVDYNDTTGVLSYKYLGAVWSHVAGATIYDPVSFKLVNDLTLFSTRNINIGINDVAPVAANDTNALTVGTNNTVTGNVTANDTIGPDTNASPVTPFNGATTYGTLTLNADGSYSYTVNTSNTTIANLLTTQYVVDTYTYTLTDGDGSSTTAQLAITITGNKSADPTDPYWANVSFYSEFNGTDNSTAFTEYKNHAMTVNGNAKISTARSVFGGSSALFDGVGDYVTGNQLNTEFAFGTGDFTVEARVYIVATTQYGGLIFGTGDANWAIQTNRTSNATGIGFIANNAIRLTYNTYLTLNAWHDIAVTRVGGILRLFLDGNKVAEMTYTTSITGGNFMIGAASSSPSNTCLNGNIDCLRITKGIGRYTSNYTVASQAFPHQ